MSAPWLFIDGRPAGRRRDRDMLVAGSVFLGMLGLVVVGWGPLVVLDEAVADWFNRGVRGSQFAVSTLHVLTDLGGAQVAWVVIPLIVVWLAIRRAPRAAAIAAVTGLGAAVLDPGIKALVDRARPVVDATVATAPGASFPSGHALGAAVTYGPLLWVFLPSVPSRHRRKVVVAAVSVVAVVGVTRTALGVHHLSDVLAGWALGVLWLGVTNILFDRGVDRQVGMAAPRSATRPAPHDRPVLVDGASTVAQLVVAAVLTWGALLAIGELISVPRGVVLAFDARLMDWAVAIRTSWLSDVARLVGRLGGTVPVMAGLLVSTVLALAITRDWRPSLFLVTAVAGETSIFLATAAIVERGRPEVEVLTGNLPPTPSFPSGHAAAAIALWGAVALLVFAWRRDWLGWSAIGAAVVIALAVALTRLYRGVHYPTDVLTSLVFTSAWLAVCWRSLQPGPPPGPDDHDRAVATFEHAQGVSR